jgi:hypothetical protein
MEAMSMNRLITMSRTRLQDTWRHVRAWKPSLPCKQEATVIPRKILRFFGIWVTTPTLNVTVSRNWASFLAAWRLTFTMALLLISPFAVKAQSPFLDPTTINLITSADVAVCHYPDYRESSYVNLHGHEFDVHQATVVYDPKDNRKVVSVAGEIYHKLSFLGCDKCYPDDKIYYHLVTGKTPEIQIDHSGVAEAWGAAFQFIGDTKVKLGVVEIDLKPSKISDIATQASLSTAGRGWEDQAKALIDMIGATGIMAADYCTQRWTDWTSEERAPVQCHSNYGAIGFACHGSYCDDVKLGCAQVPDWTWLSDGTVEWSNYFSEEGARTSSNRYICKDGGIVTGISCKGSYCDNISVECQKLASGTLDTDKCDWTVTSLSEENGGFFDFGRDKFITGVQCDGSYCDNKRFFVCPLHVPPPGTVPLKLFWSPERGDNFTTATAQGEKDALAAGYSFVRLEGYVFPTQQPGTVPLKLFWSPERGDNFTTATAQGEKDALAAHYSFVQRNEGYVFPAQ